MEIHEVTDLGFQNHSFGGPTGIEKSIADAPEMHLGEPPGVQEVGSEWGGVLINLMGVS